MTEVDAGGEGPVDAQTTTDGNVSPPPVQPDADADADAGEKPHVPGVGHYIKASNTHASASFGQAIALSADGNTLVVGSPGESSDATGVHETTPAPNATVTSAGAVYVFARSGGTWTQTHYIKPFDKPNAQLRFGRSVALSYDGTRLAIGAPGHDMNATNAGAVYVYHRTASGWAFNKLLQAPNVMQLTSFGDAVAFSGDGNTLAVGAFGERSRATGVSPNPDPNAPTDWNFAGAVYLFGYSSGAWTHRYYVKPSNTREEARFGWSVALSAAGNVLAVGSIGESSSAVGVSGTSATDTAAPGSGAVYVFEQSAGTWSETYVKAVNTRTNARFGNSVSLSSDGKTLAVGSDEESSSAKGVNPTNPGPEDVLANGAGAAYVFTKGANGWAQTAYVKASNTRGDAGFGRAVSLSTDGKALLVGSSGENSAATGVNSTMPGPEDTSLMAAGAAYLFNLAGGTWSQTAYLKAFTAQPCNFGGATAVTNGAAVLAVGASTERSDNVGVDGTKQNELAHGSGAVYTFE